MSGVVLGWKIGNRLRRLQDMLYTPAELADELGVLRETIYRSYLALGAPCGRDPNDRIWINGKLFATWAHEIIRMRRDKPRLPLDQDHAWCMRCNKIVPIQHLVKKTYRGYMYQLSGKCPECRTRVNRFLEGDLKKEGAHDQP
jgi:hypothetical protein